MEDNNLIVVIISAAILFGAHLLYKMKNATKNRWRKLYSRVVKVHYSENGHVEDKVMTLDSYLKLMDTYKCPRFLLEDFENMTKLHAEFTGTGWNTRMVYFKIYLKNGKSKQVSYVMV